MSLGVCVDVLANSRKFDTLIRNVTIPIARTAVSRIVPGSLAPASVPILPPTSTATMFMAVPVPIVKESIGYYGESPSRINYL